MQFTSARSGAFHEMRANIQRDNYARRLRDISVSLTCLFILAPLLLFCMAAIRVESRGPTLFRQRRSGQAGKEFLIFKLRTMYVTEDGPNIIQARPGDPRITRVGRVLRRTSLDEAPQLLNVLFGEMSLVGPRPHAMSHDAYYAQIIPDYMSRYHVKPGMTGWAQVNGARGETSTPEMMAHRVKLDLWYVQNSSFLLDLKILMRTPFALVQAAH